MKVACLVLRHVWERGWRFDVDMVVVECQRCGETHEASRFEMLDSSLELLDTRELAGHLALRDRPRRCVPGFDLRTPEIPLP